MYKIFFQPVKTIIPVKEVAEKALVRLGINCIRDLLFYKPSSYNIIDNSSDLSNLQDGKLIQAEVVINDIIRSSSRYGSRRIKIQVSNDTGSLLLVFFNKIPSFIFNRLHVGNKCIIAGKVQIFDGYFQITHPEFIFKRNLFVAAEPVYPLTYGIINRQLYGYILEGINAIEASIKAKLAFGSTTDSRNHYLENEKIYMQQLLSEIKALHLVGIKNNRQIIEQSIQESIEKLSAKELFANQISLNKLKREKIAANGNGFNINKSLQQSILNRLGFELTEGQKKVLSEIESDQQQNTQMMRLLQGDVGSGKTLVALLSLINVATSGYQGALMVPTDLLSDQHYKFFCHATDGSGLSIALLTGSTKKKERKELYVKLEKGEIQILIGTHALFQESVNFDKLGMVIIDEQHRFGVAQRLELIKKSSHPDVLVMTATPIPRSLTLTMFGDMNVSKLHSKPKNRLPIITSTVSTNRQDDVIVSLGKKLDINEKIYWVCPLIDQSDKTILPEENIIYADVTSRYETLRKIYPGKVSILHGKIKPAEKDAIMQDFKDGKSTILVATTVIEVGIDIAHATLIIIENAEKFGLSQLHQLRGRVGRNHLQSHCILMYNFKKFTNMARRRLEIMKSSNDGFHIAEEDLILRGGGEILGTRQSGEPNFFFADLGKDIDILLKANNLATSSIDDSDFINFQTNLFARNQRELVKSG